ncbi:MAG TPA: guanitoxin biosynthesis heme-dependent pre-guanitoxin N-hydroxylase GntA [Pyrinomonadaceae bacterium]|jgi:FPC/CPF motif-containing protein YcgG
MEFEISGIKEESFARHLSKSLYAEWNGESFRRVLEPENGLPAAARNAYEDLQTHISDEAFSCVGAKAALRGNLFRFGFYKEMNAPETNLLLAHDLRVFAAEQKKIATDFASFAAIFDAPIVENEDLWEAALWTQLKSLHEIDGRQFAWDSAVSSNPEDVNFSFSIAGTGFFIVGLHPKSSRKARRFSRMAMVFNPHAQFDRLRESGRYARMQKTIRARELKLQGSLNPNLSDFGTQSEARQYSGRAVEENWKCPFHAQMQNAKKFEE